MPKLPSANFFEIFKAFIEIFSWIRMKRWILKKWSILMNFCWGIWLKIMFPWNTSVLSDIFLAILTNYSHWWKYNFTVITSGLSGLHICPPLRIKLGISCCLLKSVVLLDLVIWKKNFYSSKRHHSMFKWWKGYVLHISIKHAFLTIWLLSQYIQLLHSFPINFFFSFLSVNTNSLS